MKVDFTVPGEPISQPRQRHALIGGHVRNYTPAKAPVQTYKALVRMAASQAMSGPPTGLPVGVTIECAFARPKSHYRTGANSHALKPNAPYRHAKKPDAENCAKAVLDALTEIVYEDDKQVACLHVLKLYADEAGSPHTKIWVETLDEGDPE